MQVISLLLARTAIQPILWARKDAQTTELATTSATSLVFLRREFRFVDVESSFLLPPARFLLRRCPFATPETGLSCLRPAIFAIRRFRKASKAVSTAEPATISLWTVFLRPVWRCVVAATNGQLRHALRRRNDVGCVIQQTQRTFQEQQRTPVSFAIPFCPRARTDAKTGVFVVFSRLLELLPTLNLQFALVSLVTPLRSVFCRWSESSV